MTRKLILGHLIALSIFAMQAHAAQNPTEEIESLMLEANRVGVFNGNVLVSYKGKVIYEGSLGYADSTRTRPLTDDSHFYIGSIEKEFNGSGLLLLQHQGKLKLEDKVSRYLSDYPSWADSVEIGQLINYTSGLPDVPDGSESGIHESLIKLRSLPVQPGTVYIYSYADVYLQQRIIERITGLSYHKFLTSQIFQPCGISSAQVDESATARGVALPFDNNFRPVNFSGSTNPGVMFTTRDLFHWMECLSSNKLLDKSSLETLSKSFGTGESSLGSAELKNGRLDTHQHQGSGYNYEALVFSDADDPAVVVLLTNNQNFKLFQLKDAILAILHGQTYIVPKKSIYLDIREGLAANFQQGMKTYLDLRKTGKDIYDFPSEPLDLISTGKYLMRRQKFDDAISVFEISTTFPLKPSDRSYAYELIADSWSKKGNAAMAVLYYEKALETGPANRNAKGMLDGLKHAIP